MGYPDIIQWLLDHLWYEAATVLFLVVSVYLAFQKHTVVELKPLRLPDPGKGSPEPEGWIEWELVDLGFRWIGDFDASSTDGVVLLTRMYFSRDNTCQAAVINVRSQDEQMSMVEFSAELAPRGGICTNNNRQPGIFSYRPEKLVVRAPWKRTAQELFALHQALCGAAAQSGFSARPIHPSDLSLHVAEDSRADYEGERARGCLYPISANTYQTTFVGALLYTPRIWFNLAHGHLFSWYHPSDPTLVARAQRRFARAADAAGLTR